MTRKTLNFAEEYSKIKKFYLKIISKTKDNKRKYIFEHKSFSKVTYELRIRTNFKEWNRMNNLESKKRKNWMLAECQVQLV